MSICRCAALFFLLSCGILCHGCDRLSVERAESQSPQWGTIEKMIDGDMLMDEGKTLAVIERLSAEIIQFPNDLRLRNTRLNLFLHLGRLAEAAADADTILELTDSNAIRFLGCLLKESRGNMDRDCYKKVALTEVSAGRMHDQLYVLSSLMAGLPGAEVSRDRYIEKLEPELGQILQMSLVPFDRKKLLYEKRTPTRQENQEAP